jgi:Uma2 family endonuclease
LPDDGRRTELVRGQVVREPQPGYEHGRVQLRVGEILARFLREHAPDFTCAGPFGVLTEEEPDTVRGPDLAVVRRSRIERLHPSGFLPGAPDLAIEVVSPSNTAADVQEKVAEYLASGAALVWVIYPKTRTVVVHDSRRHARFLPEEELLDGGSLFPALRIPVKELFEE